MTVLFMKADKHGLIEVSQFDDLSEAFDTLPHEIPDSTVVDVDAGKIYYYDDEGALYKETVIQ